MADLAPQLLAALKGDKGLYPDGLFTVIKSYRKDSIVKWDGSQWRALQLVPPGTTPVVGAYWERWIDGTPVADAAQVAADRVLSQAAAATSTAVMDSVSAAALLVAGNLTASQLAAQSAVAVSGLANLSAAARAILLDPNTVAVHVYDTRRDTDGGAWVRMLNNSIINEPLNTATRGSRKELPTLNYIAVTNTAAYILDGDDPSAPMWDVWTALGAGATASLFPGGALNGGTVSVTAGQGAICIGHSVYGLWIIDLISEYCSRVVTGPIATTGLYLGSLADRNGGKGFDGVNGVHFEGTRIALSNMNVNHVAMTVAPQTLPNSNRFNLPNPTIAVATAGGINIIRPDGTVVNSFSTSSFGRVTFDKNGSLYVTGTTTTAFVGIYEYPAYLTAAFGSFATLTANSMPAAGVTAPTSPLVPRAAGNRVVWGGATAGLTVLTRHRGILANSMVAYIDDWRNTLNQIGATKMACAESLRVLSNLQSTELLTNGSFATDLTGWTSDDLGTGFAASVWDAGNGGRLKVERLNGTNRAGRAQNITTVVGQIYRIVVVVSGATGFVSVGAVGNNAPVGTTTVSFRAISSTTTITLRAQTDATTAYIDDISIKAVIADHSPFGNHLEVIGTLNRSVVAAGAEMAMISGFSTANYAQAPYSASLDPGAGELAVPCFLVAGGPLTRQVTLVHRGDVAGTGAYYRLDTDSAGKPRFTIYDGTTAAAVVAPNAIVAGAHRIRGIRRLSPARLEIEVDGQIVATAATTGVGSLSNASAVFRVGLTTAGAFPMDAANSGLAVFGASLTAPSIEQLRAAYADDIQAFPPGSKCLLQGGSGVQDIGYDADTDLIYVAKSAGGTDVFQGLVNKATILGTTSINKFRNSGFFGAIVGGPTVGTIGGGGLMPGVTSGISMSLVSVPGTGKIRVRVFGTATATGVISWSPQSLSPTLAGAGETWTFSQEEQIVSGSLAGFTSHELRLDRIDASSATVGSSGATAIVPTSTNGRFATTVTTEAGTVNLQLRWIFRFNIGANVDVTLDLQKPQSEKAGAFTSFVDGLTDSNNHKLVSAHDGNVLIATAIGADIIMPALPLRSGVRGRRSAALYDPDVSKFNGRTTADATPTFIGDPIFVPEGGKVDFLISVTAAVPGGTASELMTTLLKGRANRNIGDAIATVFVSAVSGSPALPDKTTGTMDATVASMGGGWIGVRVTGKAATAIEWLGRQSLVRAA